MSRPAVPRDRPYRPRARVRRFWSKLGALAVDELADDRADHDQGRRAGDPALHEGRAPWSGQLAEVNISSIRSQGAFLGRFWR